MTPRTTEQNRALRDASRERLLDAAMRVFGRMGYDPASIRLIAIEAGMAQGLMYSHFKGKEELLQALFRRSMDQVRESFAAAADSGNDPESGRPALERLVHSALGLVKVNRDFWKLTYGLRMQESVVKALGRDLQAWTLEILTVLQLHFRAAGSRKPLIDAALFFAAFDGLCQHYVLDPVGYPLDPVAAALLERFAPDAKPAPARKSIPKSKPGSIPESKVESKVESKAKSRPKSKPPAKGTAHDKPRRR